MSEISRQEDRLRQLARRGSRVALLSVLFCCGFSARSEATFSQQGGMLTDGSPAMVNQGFSVALSGDGNIAVVGAPGDNSDVGSAWIYTRSGSTWTSTPTQLICAGTEGPARVGTSVAISANGAVIVVGGPRDAGHAGAVWTFERTGPSTWIPQPSKLVERPVRTLSYFGASVSLSGDGRTLVVGGPDWDLEGRGSAWAYRIRLGVNPHGWISTGTLDDATADPNGEQGVSVAVSGDGSTAIVGAAYDGANDRGLARVWTHAGASWALQMRLGNDFADGATAGQSVALSANGNAALVGGPLEPPYGAARLYIRSAGTWATTGIKLATAEPLPPGMGGSQGFSVSLSSDGKLALVGEPDFFDTAEGTLNSTAGKAWLYTPACDGSWTLPAVALQGKDPSSGALSPAGAQGNSVALSANGTTILSGADDDASGVGASWVFALDDLGPCVQIEVPCPAFYFLNNSYPFSAKVLCGTPCPAAAKFKWTLDAPSNIAFAPPPTDQASITIFTKAGPPGGLHTFLGPYTAHLCVEVTLEGRSVEKCTDLTIFRPGQQPEPEWWIASLDCIREHPIKPNNIHHRPWDIWGPPERFSASDLARIETIARDMLENAKTANAPTRKSTAGEKSQGK